MTAARSFVLIACLLAAHAHAQQWFSLSGADTQPGATVMEVDLSSLQRHDHSAAAIVRVSYTSPQHHPVGFPYRSFIATSTIDCTRRTVGVASAAYFAQPQAQGGRVGADSAGLERGMPEKLVDSIPAAMRQALIRAACPVPP